MKITNRIITQEDVERLNQERGSTIVLQNTVGQDPEILKQLSPDIKIQIIGGYDPDKKPKYKEDRIIRRTFYNPQEVSQVIEKFQEYEQGIDPTWSDLEKAIYMYKRIGADIQYVDTNARSEYNLVTLLSGGVCAGIATVFKEAMDRLGIECETINEPRTHTWNAIKINGVWYPVDLTWDRVAMQEDPNCNPF